MNSGLGLKCCRQPSDHGLSFRILYWTGSGSDLLWSSKEDLTQDSRRPAPGLDQDQTWQPADTKDPLLNCSRVKLCPPDFHHKSLPSGLQA